MSTNDELDARRTLQEGDAPRADWLQRCILTDTKKPIPNLANALIGLRAEMPDSFAYDAMLCVPMLMRPLEAVDGFKPRVLADVDVGIVQQLACTKEYRTLSVTLPRAKRCLRNSNVLTGFL